MGSTRTNFHLASKLNTRIVTQFCIYYGKIDALFYTQIKLWWAATAQSV